MEPKFNTSFIPKKSLQADVTGSSAGGKYVGRRTIHGPGYFFAMLLFLVSAVASLGLFGYTKIVESAIAEKIVRLEELKASFDPKSVDLLTRVDAQITQAQKLLTQHVAVSELFTLLEKITLKRVQYTALTYAGVPGESVIVTIDGLTQTFQNVALQTEQYKGDVNLTNPTVKELERVETGAVHFSVDLAVDQRLILFSTYLKNASSNSSSETNTVPNEENATLEDVDQGTSTDPAGVTKGDS